MPRLSLYRPEKGNDYKFIDRQSSEMFQVGGTDVYVHKYLGPVDPTDPTKALGEAAIQDLVFLENRDRKYDPDIYRIRGIYNVQDLDFNLSQFGLFIDNDTVYMTVHINDFLKTIGRKPLSGDVLELPHIKDEFALNDIDISLPRYFVISDVGRAAEGFSPTWFPHLYRLKLTKIMDSQQFKDIFDAPATDADGNPSENTTLRDLLSTQSAYLQVNQGVIAEAEANAAKSGYETRQFYTLAVDDSGKPAILTVDDTLAPPDTSSTGLDASTISKRPKRDGYDGYITGDGIAPNGVDFGHGIMFPSNAVEGDFFLRVDMLPNRLFRFDGIRWIKYEDNVRMTMTNTDTRQTQRTKFINNSNKTGVGFITSDLVRISIDTTTLLTTEDYVAGQFATANTNNGIVPSVEVSSGAGGKALLTFSDIVPAGEQLQWKLYAGSIDERVALSKVLRYKPEADL